MIKSIVLTSVLGLTVSGAAMADGFYAGAGLGGSELQAKYTGTLSVTGEPTKTSSSHGSASGLNATVLAGYAWEDPDSYFVGLEAFDNNSSAQTTTTVTTGAVTGSIDVETNNVYGVRVLPGYHLTQDTVGYGILGVARSNMQVTGGSGGYYGTSDYNFNGYQLGLGSMTNLSTHFALRGDVIYSAYESQAIITSAGNDVSLSEKLKPATMEFNLVAVYKFG